MGSVGGGKGEGSGIGAGGGKGCGFGSGSGGCGIGVMAGFNAGSSPQVRAQMKAGYDNGFQSWILWNPGSRYTESALRPEGAETASAK